MMNVKTAKRMAKVDSSATIYNWLRSQPDLARKIGGRFHIDDAAFIAFITQGENLLDLDQANGYAAGLTDKSCADLELLIEIENTIPEDVEPRKHRGSYFYPACIPWRDVREAAWRHMGWH